MVLRRRSVTIVDFKDYGGTVRTSENERWLTDEGVRVLGGGNDVNPFGQVRRYKGFLASWLSETGLLPPTNDPGHISGLVMFTRTMAVDASAMGHVARKWFCAADQQGAVNFLRDRASPRLELSADCIARIVEAMKVNPFKLQPGEKWVPVSALEQARNVGYFDAMQDVEDQKQAEWWAQNGDRVQEQYDAACRGWAIHDALALIRRALEQQHPGEAFADEVVVALDHAFNGGKPSICAVIRTYQPRTELDLTGVLRSWGVEPNDFG